jgi:hypothetical protein
MTADSAVVMPCSANARTSPGTSVLAATRVPSGSTSSVFAAPTSRDVSSAASTRSSATRLSGIVSDSPRSPGSASARNDSSWVSSISYAW